MGDLKTDNTHKHTHTLEPMIRNGRNADTCACWCKAAVVFHPSGERAFVPFIALVQTFVLLLGMCIQ